jgi:hypothetical protein
MSKAEYVKLLSKIALDVAIEQELIRKEQEKIAKLKAEQEQIRKDKESKDVLEVRADEQKQHTKVGSL